MREATLRLSVGLSVGLALTVLPIMLIIALITLARNFRFRHDLEAPLTRPGTEGLPRPEEGLTRRNTDGNVNVPQVSPIPNDNHLDRLSFLRAISIGSFHSLVHTIDTPTPDASHEDSRSHSPFNYYHVSPRHCTPPHPNTPVTSSRSNSNSIINEFPAVSSRDSCSTCNKYYSPKNRFTSNRRRGTVPRRPMTYPSRAVLRRAMGNAGQLSQSRETVAGGQGATLEWDFYMPDHSSTPVIPASSIQGASNFVNDIELQKLRTPVVKGRSLQLKDAEYWL